jgi:hypothetical protein
MRSRRERPDEVQLNFATSSATAYAIASANPMRGATIRDAGSSWFSL